jgi:hypothetical protein
MEEKATEGKCKEETGNRNKEKEVGIQCLIKLRKKNLRSKD